MTPLDLRDLLVKRLTVAVGGSAQRWRKAVGSVKVHPLATHAHCNWSVTASGSSREIEAVEQMLDTLRAEHPFVDAA